MTAISKFERWCLPLHGGAHSQSVFLPFIFFAVVLAGFWPLAGHAQDSQSGVQYGNFNVQQSTEFGYRFTGVNGSQPMYDTYVDLPSGPRMLEQTFSLRSLTRKGALIDDLYVSSFGYGGDPDTATRLRASKDHWYDFTATYRRDRNFFDYNLLANPLNPVNPYIQVNDSPHSADLVRKMQDYALVLAPQSSFRVRLGYSRNSNAGPSYTTLHEGTDALLYQPFQTLTDSLSFGFDYRFAPRTTFSYDQSWDHFRNDTYWQDQSFNFVLSNNTPVDAGLAYNAALNQPCAKAFSANPLGGVPVLLATCNGYQAYTRTGDVRSLFPTEKLSLQSSYFKKLEFTASALYSAGTSEMNQFAENFLGLLTRTNQRAFQFSGPAQSERILGSADFGATWQITGKLRFTESFRYYNSRLPGAWLSADSSLFGTNSGSSLLFAPAVFSAATCPPPYTAATCPKHTSSSGPDTESVSYINAQDSLLLMNTADLQYDFTARLGVHAGYRWTERSIAQSATTDSDAFYYPPNPTRNASLTCSATAPNGTCQVITSTSGVDSLDITQQGGLFGLWMRPVDSLRVNADVEIATADGAVTRISPRNLQHYKFRSAWKPYRWASLTANLNWLEQRNNRIAGTFNGGDPDQHHLDHTRTLALAAMLMPSERLSIDIGFDWQDVDSSTESCINLGAVSTAFPACNFGPGSVLQNSLGQWQYQATVYGGHANFIVKPVKKLTASLGYDLTNSVGTDLYNSLFVVGVSTQPNPLQPQGTLSYLWHKPTASIAYDVTSHWTAKGAWGFYDYNERGYEGPVLPRDFHAETGTVSLRYTF